MIAPWARKFLASDTFGARQTLGAALDGAVVPKSGTTAQRPTGVAVGYLYYDTTISKVIVLKTAPSSWTDTNGTAV